MSLKHFTRRLILTGLILFGTAIAMPALGADRDLDGIDDAADNCLWVPNADQRDTNGDGYGNRCDPDLDDDGQVTSLDFGIFRSVLFGPGVDADFDGNGFVDVLDFGVFLSRFGGEPGPGAVEAAAVDVVCDWADWCRVSVLPGIHVEASSEQLEERADGTIRLIGDVEIPTPAGPVILGDADLIVLPGVSMLGSAIEPDYRIGSLSNEPELLFPSRVGVSTALGADLDFEISLYDDVHYVVFDGGDLAEWNWGNVELVVPSAGWKLVLDPVDPFIYSGAEWVVPSYFGGLEFSKSGAGFGVSLSGRAPFELGLPEVIADSLPTIHGDSVHRLNATLEAPLSITVDGFGVFEHDPDGDGDPIFGDAGLYGEDHRFGLDGTISLGASLFLPGLSLNLGEVQGTFVRSYTGARGAHPKRETWISGRLPQVEDVNAVSRGWYRVPDERSAFVLYFGPEQGDNYLRMATENAISLDTIRMAAAHGATDIGVMRVTDSVLNIDARAITISSDSFGQSLHPDVVYTERQASSLQIPFAEDLDFELRIDTRAELGNIALDEYGILLNQDVFQHWGRYQTNNYVYALAGEYGVNGPWLEGSVQTVLPYRYPELDLAIDLAGQIAAQEEAARLAELDYQAAIQRLADLEASLRAASDYLSSMRSGLRSANSALEAAERELKDLNDTNCGSCAWYDAVCWAEVGVCESWKTLARPALEKAVDVAEAGVRSAQAAVTAAQAAVQRWELEVAVARNAAILASAAADEILEVLVALRAERAALPEEEGEVDVVVSLRVSRDGLTGTVAGRFFGEDFGTGYVENTVAGPKACFIVPQTGEELCTDL